MSKIRSESNSQLDPIFLYLSICCVQYVKDTIWKQFTTMLSDSWAEEWLCSVCQRYDLKAIHNRCLVPQCPMPAVFSMSKIRSESNSQRENGVKEEWISCVQYVKDTIWKQFTTKRELLDKNTSCVQYVKDTIWKQFTTGVAGRKKAALLCSVCQRYDLKAIHNSIPPLRRSVGAVFSMSKIRSESNSQHSLLKCHAICCCVQYVKDTIWKQFTTRIGGDSRGFRCVQYVKDKKPW